MKDKNGTWFTSGAKLQSTQSSGNAGIIQCTRILDNVATFVRILQLPVYEFNMTQESMNKSLWVVRENKGDQNEN